MRFRMSSLRRSKSGAYSARKGIPKDVREDYARLYGASWEAKFFAPAEVKPGEAKSRFNEWLAEVENRSSAIRAPKNGQGQSLSRREVHALSGEWYKWYVARHEGDPGSPESWRVLWDVLIDRLEDFAP
jgi:hypothetical protein